MRLEDAGIMGAGHETLHQRCVWRLMGKTWTSGEYAAIPPSYPTTLRDELIIDTQRNHFQLITVGWEGSQFVHEAIFHLDIIDGKVWIQQNNSEAKLTNELIERGVEKSDIVLGFQHPEARVHSGFAAA